MNDEPKNNDWGMTMPHLPREKTSNADDFSDEFAAPSKHRQQQTSDDDWGITTPNLALPQHQMSDSDYDKTTPNINIPADDWQTEQPQTPSSAPDEWSMTAPDNDAPAEEKHDEDWGISASNIAGAKNEKSGEWSMPTPVFRHSEGTKQEDFQMTIPPLKPDQNAGFDKTTPNINLESPAASAGKTPLYIDLSEPAPSIPAAPASAVENQPKGDAPKSKLPLIIGGISAMFLIVAGFLAGIYFLFFNEPKTAQNQEAVKEEKLETSSVNPAPIADVSSDLPKTIELKGTMMLIPAGEFTMGSDAGEPESRPAHKVTLPAFYMDKTEVTNAEYKAFCDATGHSVPPDSHLESNYFSQRPNAPVVGVSFDDAKAYAAWAGKRLPTEEEWEKAASWDESTQMKRDFPWGDDFQKNNAAFGTEKISDVGKYPNGASPFGVLDMAGNVLEWVDAYFQPYQGGTATNAEFGEKNRVVRGGHFASKSVDSLKTTKRIYIPLNVANGGDNEKLVAVIIGFRCAVSADDAKVRDVLAAQGK